MFCQDLRLIITKDCGLLLPVTIHTSSEKEELEHTNSSTWPLDTNNIMHLLLKYVKMSFLNININTQTTSFFIINSIYCSCWTLPKWCPPCPKLFVGQQGWCCCLLVFDLGHSSIVKRAGAKLTVSCLGFSFYPKNCFSEEYK